MNTIEKAYSVFAIIFAITLISVLVIIPEMRQMHILLTASGIGLFVNVILMFIVFRDIFYRPALTKGAKACWTVGLLIFWPAILVYIPVYGFRKRD